MKKPKLKLFQGYGIELEYMLVHQDSLNVLDIVDTLLKKKKGRITNEFVTEDGMGWANELVCHVIEVHNQTPTYQFDHLKSLFAQSIQDINSLAKEYQACLMPTSMHPWMNPIQETRIWPHQYHEIYSSFHRLFDCHRHGWANLQSCQINLPFANNDEFSRLMASIRFILPILPTITASSPFKELQHQNCFNHRLKTYRSNSQIIPSISADCIPEPIYDIDQYHEQILQKIYHDLAPLDPNRILQDEWVNARGAIARFDRYAIEIRTMDIQENPTMDLAICELIVKVIQAICYEKWSSMKKIQAFPQSELLSLHQQAIDQPDHMMIDNEKYLSLLGLSAPISSYQLWNYFLNDSEISHGLIGRYEIEKILNQGTLARRIFESCQNDFSKNQIQMIYHRLCDCLARGVFFEKTTP